MNPQYHCVNGGWPLTQNVYSGEKVPGSYEQNMSYGANAPYGANVPYSANPPYGRNPMVRGANVVYGQNEFYHGNAPYGNNAPYERNTPYGGNVPYGINQPYGQNAPYGVDEPYGANPVHVSSPSYGQNVPYHGNASYGMNQPYGQNAPYGVDEPYGANPVHVSSPSYGQNVPYHGNVSYGINQPYGQNAPYGENEPYGANPVHVSSPSYGQNVPSHGNASYGMNAPYEQNTSYGINVPYEQNMPYNEQNASYGMNQPYGQNAPYGMNSSGMQNESFAMIPLYGRNLPCEVNPPFGGTASHGLPAVYTAGQGQQGMIEPYRSRYQFAPNSRGHARRDSKEGFSQLLLFSIAGVIIAAFLAIMIGMAVNDDGMEMNVSEVFSSWVAGLSSENENEESLPEVSFLTRSTETVRGEMFAVGEDGSVFLRTEYGVCRVAKNGSSYEYNGWAAALDSNLEVRSMAVYDGYLYLACGENGIYRVNTARSNTLTQIIDDYVTSFVIAGDNLFYLSTDYPEDISAETFDEYRDHGYGYYGELYIAGLNGKGSRPLGEKVRRAGKYLSSADFVCVDGYLYFFDSEGNIKRIRTNGTGSRVVVEQERQKPSFVSCGLYENGGVLYLPSWGGGIYSYDIEADRLRKVSDAYITESAPILFAGNALLYKERWECVWHQIKDGQDTVFESPLNDAALWMQAVGVNELIAADEQRGGSMWSSGDAQSGYVTVSFMNGEIRSEVPVNMDYAVMPEVDMEEEPFGLLQGTEQADCRASHFVFVGPNESSVYDHYVIYPYVTEDHMYVDMDNSGLIWTYADENGEHTELLVEGEVGTFFVENDVLFYTQWNVEDGGYAFYFRSLDVPAEEAAEGCLIDSGMQQEFTCLNGMIYYVSVRDGRLYRYTLWSSESERISEAKVGCYDIYNGMIYYEDLSDKTIWKMRMDGTEAEQLDTPVDGEREALRQLKVCPYDGSVYLAVTLEGEQDQYADMCLFAEDGSMEFYFDADIGSFDRKQTLYYRDGLLYYSADFAFSIHVFNFEEYFEGGSGIREGAYDTVFCEENMNTFEVTEEFVYVQMYMDEHIKVFDRLTGELIDNIGCRQFWNLQSGLR